MKRAISLLLALVMMLSFCACGGSKPSGYYKDNIGFSVIHFHGNKVELEMPTGTSNGTFTMDGDTVKIEYDDGGQDTYTYDKETDTLDFHGVMTLSKEK